MTKLGAERGRLQGLGGAVGAVAFAVTVLTVALLRLGHPPDAPTVYARYVSPPLGDGSRYTFLYPAALGKVSAYAATLRDHRGKRHQIRDVCISARVTPLQALLRRKWFLRQAFRQEQVEQVRATLSDDPAEPAYVPAGSPAPSPNPRYTRSESLNPVLCEHDVTLTDRRTRVRFTFSHLYWGGAQEAFTRDDAAIARSFCVLPPGAAIPPTVPPRE